MLKAQAKINILVSKRLYKCLSNHPIPLILIPVSQEQTAIIEKNSTVLVVIYIISLNMKILSLCHIAEV